MLGDQNERLVRAYRGVKSDPERVITFLKSYPHSKSFYLELRGREIDAETDAEVAAWLVYLNKTGYNGLYRVNSRHIFNVPYGDYAKPNYCDQPTLRACSKVLRGATIRHGDFEEVTKGATKGDFVYFDPPYIPRSASSYFTSYTASGFASAEQERLRDVALRLKRRGVHVLLSNSATPQTEQLYARDFSLMPVYVTRRINTDIKSRGDVKEFLIK